MIRPFDPTLDSKDELQELVFASQIYQHMDLEHQDITENHLRALWTGAVDAHFMDKKICYLIDAEGDTIDGFVRVQRNKKQNTVLIDDLYVTPEARSHGLGLQLVEAAKDWTKQVGAERLTLSVHHANVAGRKLYEKSGFVTIEPEYVDLESSV